MLPELNLAYVIISAMLTLIIIIHILKFRSENKNWMKILIIGSGILFVMICVGHVFYIKKENDKKHINQQDIDNIIHNPIINIHNKAFELLIKVSDHPIFHITW